MTKAKVISARAIFNRNDNSFKKPKKTTCKLICNFCELIDILFFQVEL